MFFVLLIPSHCFSILPTIISHRRRRERIRIRIPSTLTQNIILFSNFINQSSCNAIFRIIFLLFAYFPLTIQWESPSFPSYDFPPTPLPSSIFFLLFFFPLSLFLFSGKPIQRQQSPRECCRNAPINLLNFFSSFFLFRCLKTPYFGLIEVGMGIFQSLMLFWPD